MRLSIFARLVIGYLLLFLMLAGISLYFIHHLNRFNQVTRSIILNDTTDLEYVAQLSDALLAESRYDRKYIVLKDEGLYANYRQANSEFTRIMDQALATTSGEIHGLFAALVPQHEALERLVQEERALLKNAKPYQAARFADDKKKTADDILEQLKKIRQESEKNVFGKIVLLSDSGDKARNLSIVISVMALTAGLIVAFLITRSIKKPLDLMRTKTIEISRGNFKGDLAVSSPPVIAELAAAINTMCHKLQEIEDIKSDFFAHMSHELRTPLASIKEGTTMLIEGLGGEITDRQERILKIMVEESNRLIELVNSLLDLSKMEAGMLAYQFTRTDLPTLVQRALELLAPLAGAKKITMDNRVGPLPPVAVDQERVLQVLHNILGNAIKFTPKKGRITVGAKTEKGAVEVAVHDTGTGIPPDDLERIFHKFEQAKMEKGQKLKGTGLGLAIARQIIIAHGGKIWATSQPGQGSVFYFTLPLAA